ncbi:DNA-3-methyladenine glycosylase I [Dethiosulfovibrio peptidovorans DSM 11002]|uniref:DNA-3-methyladenine glycosylase I n=1 Tax=Dethiosulfovibrio peptidovorans DSM 11002 TaxID=469381 RepID=D2Z783_9BACT|nr:DNA-3-methyladenine glycosylase I [Dethiosulfovibrio peptidovorans]EFC91330.1 DNA-3-methyladenine glycosylase I [Dethiosulfovibrio peptidovorans DSM 11002]
MNDIFRCPWCGEDPLYVAYHDSEWGVPLRDDWALFELLCLEGAQAGLSWITVLRKREAYRRVFDRFDPGTVARYDQRRIEEILTDRGIIRNRLKVRSVVKNARAFLDLQEREGSFSQYLWGFVEGKPIQNRWRSLSQVPAESELSRRISKDMKKRGFQFVGPVIIYSLIQSAGLVNDHLVDCFRYDECFKMQ